MVEISPSGSAGDSCAVICGVGYWVPPLVVTNADLCARLDTSDEWIQSRTGIATRRVAEAGVATSDLAVEAGARALKSAGDGEVQALVLATTTPDRLCPATAPDVASRLGLTGIAAFDVSAACAGFLHALATAVGLIATSVADRVLVIGADTFSAMLDPDDRTTAPIFGDGAGAMVLRRGSATEPGAIGRTVLGSDGAGADLIVVPGGGARERSERRHVPLGPSYFHMRGREVFRHAVERMSTAAIAARDAAGWGPDDVVRLVLHQANARITAAVAAELGIPPEHVAENIRDIGNTVAGSVPILLAQAAASGYLAPGHRVLVSAFGGGLAWGATTMVWPELTNVM